MPRKSIREGYKIKGLCISCGSKDRREGKTKCQKCADRSNKYRLDKNGKVLPKYREISNLYLRKRRGELKKLVDKYKLKRGCTDCGYDENSVALDFDHLPGFTKNKNITVMRTSSYTWKRILEEIHKCEVVCANCHRVRTRKRANLL